MRVFLVCAFVLLATIGSAQTATRIDGRLHPELIPDNAAYRAVFLMHSHFAAPAETERSEQFHARLALTAGDHEAYDQILKDFRLQYENLVLAHNAFVDSGSSASVASLRDEMTCFNQSVSILVQTTRSKLTARMTKEALAKLNTFVQSEKSHMVVGVRSAQ